MSNQITRDLFKIFMSCVSAVLPQHLIRKSLQYNSKLQKLSIFDKIYNLRNKNVYVVGTGKAVLNMAKEIDAILGSKIVQGIVSVPKGSYHNDKMKSNIQYYEGATNNLPDDDAEFTAKKVKTLASKLDKDDILIVLISGGGSALLPLPQDPITLQDKLKIIKDLANAGADIKELNTVRKKLSSLKGGQLAVQAQPAEVVSLILSDIVGDPLDLIASGPTTKNEDTPAMAVDIIKKYNLYNNMSDRITNVLNENKLHNVEFPSKNVNNYIIGSNKLSIQAAMEHAKELSYIPVEISNTVIGNIKLIAQEYGKLVTLLCNLITNKISIDMAEKQLEIIDIPNKNTLWLNNIMLNSENKSICLIFGGEPTVEVKGTGKGGRNQQLAIEFSKVLHENKSDLCNFEIYFLSAGTDGIDGPTDAAGAIGYLDLVSDAKHDGLNIEDFLINNNSYGFYKKFKNGAFHIVTGHSYTNVMDIHLIIIKKRCRKNKL